MNAKEFQAILNDEIKFHHKQFQGDTEADKKDDYMRFIERYYESLGYLTQQSLVTAFKKCRENFEYFPKINQLLKFCTAQKPKEKVIDYKALPQSEASKKLMKQAMIGGNKYQVGEKVMRNNIAHLAQRWPHSDWDKVLVRELEIDSHRMVRE